MEKWTKKRISGNVTKFTCGKISFDLGTVRGDELCMIAGGDRDAYTRFDDTKIKTRVPSQSLNPQPF